MSLQVCIPCGCPNKCPFCVSRQHENAYFNLVDDQEREFIKRLQYARENNYQTVVLTGTGEPLTNPDFIRRFGNYNALLNPPFRWIELQTSGVNLGDSFKLLKNAGVVTIALSLVSIFDSNLNAEIMGIPEELRFSIDELCSDIKSQGFNLRLSLNMWSGYNNIPPEDIMNQAREFKANQVTFKVLYSEKNDTPQAKWIEEHKYMHADVLNRWIIEHGMELEMLPFGAVRYDVGGISTVVDLDCMGPAGPKNAKQIRYLILRPDCRLYTRWDSRGSLLF